MLNTLFPRNGANRKRAAGLAAGAAVAAMLLTGCSSPATGDSASDGGDSGDLKTLRVSLGWIKNVEWAGFWTAEKEGYFADEGLKIEWQSGGPNAPTPEASVASGDADLGITASLQATLQATTQGNDFVAVGAVFQDSPSSLISLADNPIRDVEDLKGKTVLSQDGSQPSLDAMFKLAGMKPDYNFIPVGFDIAPLVDGQGDVYTGYATNQALTLQSAYGLSEDDYVVVPVGELGLPQYGSVIFGERPYLKDNSDAIEGFLRATLRGWEENEKDPAVGAGLAVSEYGADLGLDLDQQTKENAMQIGFTKSDATDEHGLLWMDTERLGNDMYAGLKASGITDLPEPDAFVDMSYLEAASK